MMKTFTLERTEPTDQLTLAIVGPPKNWKSNIAATCRKPALLMDYDLRCGAIIDKKGVFAIQLVDPPHPKPQTVIPIVFDVLTCLERSKKVVDLVTGALKLFPDAEPSLEFKTIIHDSAGSLSKASLNFILGGSPDLRYAVTVGAQFTNYTPKSWTGWVSDVAMVEQIILRSIATGLDTIITLHEAAEESVDSSEEQPKFTGRVTVYPVRYARLLKNFNEVWRTKMVPATGVNKLVAKVSVAQQWDFNASTCMLLDPLEEPDISKLIAKHELRMKEKK